MGRVLVVGTGLIGTSIGLALRAAGIDVALDDRDPAALAMAVARGAGRPWGDVDGGPERGPDGVDHVVLAVPPAAVAGSLLLVQRLGLDTTYSDTASVKAAPLAEAEERNCDLTRFVGGHPFAGRERGGPDAADGELFLGRTWALCPTPATGAAALAAARTLVLACGARPLVTSPTRHDATAAALSHVPQLVASALAASSRAVDVGDLRLVGQGFLDTTRIADSDPALWADIVAANAAPIRDVLQAVVERLSRVVAALGQEDGLADVARALLSDGNAARRRLPDKTADRRTRWERVTATVADRPGELARLLLAAAAAGVNVEDLRVEHAATGLGLADLDVVQGSGVALVQALRAQGWRAHVADLT